ncbi:GD17681 [Drosophila simulans]|uniref:GD17681 n=1 Tax=Drosophila simulans TaxID=7240 RepID=B4NSS5_DROSI|nr:GD17681 [Drosophila simulans]
MDVLHEQFPDMVISRGCDEDIEVSLNILTRTPEFTLQKLQTENHFLNRIAVVYFIKLHHRDASDVFRHGLLP